MPHFKAKMHQIRSRLGLCPRPRWGTYSAPQTLWLDLGGPTSNGRGGRAEKKRKKRKEEGKGAKERAVREGKRRGR